MFCENVTKFLVWKVLHPAVFEFGEQCPQPYTDVCVVFSQAEFLADLAAYDIVTLLLDIFSYVLAFKSEQGF